MVEKTNHNGLNERHPFFSLGSPYLGHHIIFNYLGTGPVHEACIEILVLIFIP